MYYVGSMAFDPNYLAHHGIKGQKWGVRRFQNPDGTLTEAGKKRRVSTTKANPRDRIDDMQKRVLDPNESRNNEDVRQRSIKAADVGLKALTKLGRGVLAPDEQITGAHRFWFLMEDQTIGLPQIADLMANQKWTAKQVKQYVIDVRTAEPNLPDDYIYTPAVFYFTECGDLNTVGKFIDACEAVINEAK